jgi:MYXO-CTERM domain-containing protein
MLTTFGTFWGAEGAGVDWPGGDASLPVVLGFVVLISLGYVTALRRRKVALA